MVTVEILKNAGYPISGLKDDTQVTLAEANIKAAYFESSETFETDEAIQLLYALVYSYIIKMRLTATRYGTVQKVSQYSINADNQLVRDEIRMRCRLPLERYHKDSGFDFMDILEIYDELFVL